MDEQLPLRLTGMSGIPLQARLAKWSVLPLLLALAVALLCGRPRRSSHGLNIAHNGVHAPYNLHNHRGELLLYNFRVVEPGLLYRGSGFPANRRGVLAGRRGLFPAAFFDAQAFNFLRAHHIRTIISLQAGDAFYAERGYIAFWSRRTHYRMQVQWLPVVPGFAYARDARQLMELPIEGRRFGLKAATQLIELLAGRKASQGAVYLHDAAGKDSVGVVVAAYELWRNQGLLPREQLWRQVMNRYLVSNTVLGRDRAAAAAAGGRHACGSGQAPGFVCGRELEKLRPDLESIATL